jgi:hypothetical protein
MIAFLAKIAAIFKLVKSEEEALILYCNAFFNKPSAYTPLVKFYLSNGRIEDAARVVINVNQSLGADYVPSFQSIDVRTAHMIKAGYAALRLLGSGETAHITLRGKEEDKPKKTPLSVVKE